MTWTEVKNQLKTFILLGSLTFLLLWIGSYFGKVGMNIAIFLAVLMNVFSYFFGDQLILMIYNCQPSQDTRLNNIVRNLALKAGLHQTKVYISSLPVPNAFATGRGDGIVVVTKPLLDILDSSELEAVIAHELGHIRHRDILISTVASVIAMAISYLAYNLRWFAIFFGLRDEDDTNIFELIALSILIPFISTIIQLSISRSREYLADAFSVKLTRKPNKLISALRKLHNYAHSIKGTSMQVSASNLFIVNPFSSSSLFELLSTHPSLENRIKNIERVAKEFHIM